MFISVINKIAQRIKLKSIYPKLHKMRENGMIVHRLRNFEKYLIHSKRNKDLVNSHKDYLSKLIPENKDSFTAPGYSYTAGKQVDFLVDYEHSGGTGSVNWRERVCCPDTYFNNRMRATFHLFDLEMECYPDSNIYITEQITPIYQYFKGKYLRTTGSEFLNNEIPFGMCDENGVRNETLCSLSFPDETFDALLSFDVMEHIPDYFQAFVECARVLKAGGKMMWSVPFIASSYKNLIRATIKNDTIKHILPPEFHGDPLSSEGLLCFQHFGWEMLDQVREAGFSDAYALNYQSKGFGYLGENQFIFFATK